MCGYVFHYPEHVKPDVPLVFLKQQKKRVMCNLGNCGIFQDLQDKQ